jgi:hypothetical protein
MLSFFLGFLVVHVGLIGGVIRRSLLSSLCSHDVCNHYKAVKWVYFVKLLQ